MRTRIASEETGFTLVELLVVVLVIGILAAIALAMFGTQKEKGQDADAKSNASALVSAVDRCYVFSGDFTVCDGVGPNDELGKTGLPMGAGREKVSVTAATFNTFEVTAVAASGHRFIVNQGPTSTQMHTCDAGTSGIDGGGCTNGSW